MEESECRVSVTLFKIYFTYIQHPRLGSYGQCCNEDLVWIENGYKDKSGLIKEGYASTEYLFLTQSILKSYCLLLDNFPIEQPICIMQIFFP